MKEIIVSVVGAQDPFNKDGKDGPILSALKALKADESSRIAGSRLILFTVDDDPDKEESRKNAAEKVAAIVKGSYGIETKINSIAGRPDLPTAWMGAFLVCPELTLSDDNECQFTFLPASGTPEARVALYSYLYNFCGSTSGKEFNVFYLPRGDEKSSLTEEPWKHYVACRSINDAFGFLDTRQFNEAEKALGRLIKTGLGKKLCDKANDLQQLVKWIERMVTRRAAGKFVNCISEVDSTKWQELAALVGPGKGSPGSKQIARALLSLVLAEFLLPKNGVCTTLVTRKLRGSLEQVTKCPKGACKVPAEAEYPGEPDRAPKKVPSEEQCRELTEVYAGASVFGHEYIVGGESILKYFGDHGDPYRTTCGIIHDDKEPLSRKESQTLIVDTKTAVGVFLGCNVDKVPFPITAARLVEILDARKKALVDALRSELGSPNA